MSGRIDDDYEKIDSEKQEISSEDSVEVFETLEKHIWEIVDNTANGVLIVSTGGKITRSNNELGSVDPETVDKHPDSNLIRSYIDRKIFRLDDKSQPAFEYDIKEIYFGDKKHISMADWRMLSNVVMEADQDIVLITAKRAIAPVVASKLYMLKDRFSDKLVLITSAHAHFEGSKFTDARFNLGFSIGAAATTRKRGEVMVIDRGWVFNPLNFELEPHQTMSKRYLYEEDSEGLLFPNDNDNLKEGTFAIMGGTIDGQPNDVNDGFVEMKSDSVIPDFLKSLSLKVDLTYEIVCMKDSRDVQQDHRESVAQLIRDSRRKVFFITHGTYTMPDTARWLMNRLQEMGVDEKKLVILLGSMIPLEGYTISDADFNLGYALGVASQLWPQIEESDHQGPVVKLAMNAQIFDPEKVEKNTKVGRFEDSGLIDVKGKVGSNLSSRKFYKRRVIKSPRLHKLTTDSIEVLNSSECEKKSKS